MSGHDIARDADVLLHDGQYRDHEYGAHVGWGHSSIGDAMEFANKADVERLVLFHHDPYHTDDELEALLGEARGNWPGMEERVSPRRRGHDDPARCERRHAHELTRDAYELERQLPERRSNSAAPPARQHSPNRNGKSTLPPVKGRCLPGTVVLTCIEVGEVGGGLVVVAAPVVVVTICSCAEVVVFGTVVVVTIVVSAATVVVVYAVVVDAVVVVHWQLWSAVAPAATGTATTANVPIVAASTSLRLLRRVVPTTRCTTFSRVH